MSIRDFINAKKQQFREQRVQNVQTDIARRQQSLSQMQEERRLMEEQKALKDAEAAEKAKLRDMRTPEFLKNYGQQVGKNAVEKNTKQPSLFAQNNLDSGYNGMFGKGGVSEYKGPFANDAKPAKAKKEKGGFMGGIPEYKGLR